MRARTTIVFVHLDVVPQPVTQVKVEVFPDGGMNRLRVFAVHQRKDNNKAPSSSSK